MSKFVVVAGWDDVPHLSAEAKQSLYESYPVHERNARTKGVPQLGAGAIYPLSEDEFVCDPFELPAWYRHAYAMDVGWNRTAALWGALDPETDILYLYSEHYRGQAEPSIHADAIKSRGKWIPGVIDPAAKGRSQVDGQKLLTIYRDRFELNLLEADNAVEAGIYEVWQRLSSGRMKVFRNLQNWLSEYRIYRRDDKGKVVKENDHLMDDTRYLVVSGLTIATQRPAEEWIGRPGVITNRQRHQYEHDPFANARGVVHSAPQGLKQGWMPGRK